MCSEAVKCEPLLVHDVPVRLRTREMCRRTVEKCLLPFRFILDNLKTKKMCGKAAEKDPYQLGDFSDSFKTKRMCEKAVEDEPEALEYVQNILRQKNV